MGAKNLVTKNSTICTSHKTQCDTFGTRPKKMRVSQRLFIRF